MTDPSLAARLRDVLSPAVFRNADAVAQAAMAKAVEHEASDCTVERIAHDAYRDAIVAELLPLLLSLQEEQRRAMETLITQSESFVKLVSFRGEDLRRDASQQLRNAIASAQQSLASSSSASARREQE